MMGASVDRTSWALAALVALLSLFPFQRAEPADGFWLMASNLNLTGQRNWNYHNGGDSPEGAYMGWLYGGTTNLQGTVGLGKSLSPGQYYVMLKVIDYMGGGRIEVLLGNGSASVGTTNEDWNRYWTEPVAVQTTQSTSNLVVNLLKTVPPDSVQKYLLRGLYITTNVNENVVLRGEDRIANWLYSTNVDARPTVKRNYLENSSFEVGMGHGWGYKAEGYNRDSSIGAFCDTNKAYHGTASARFLVKGYFVSRVYSLRPNRYYTLSAYACGTQGHSLLLSVFNVATPPPGFPPQVEVSQWFTIGPNWQRYSVSGFLPSYPHTDYEVLISCNATDSNAWVDAVQLEEGDLSEFNTSVPVELSFTSDKPGRVFFEDENLALKLLAYNNSSQPFSGTLAYEIYDIFNRRIVSGEQALSVAATNHVVQPFLLSTTNRGIFRLVAWLKDRTNTMEEVVYGVVPRPRVEGFDETSIMGVHPNLVQFELATLERLGIKWNRIMSPEWIFRWSYVEPVEGEIIWFDDKINCSTNYGMTLLGTIGTNDYWPPWAETNGLPNLDKWESFVGRLVTHYKDRVKWWEIWNEPNYRFTVEFYGEMLKRAANAIRSADPSAKIVGMGGVYYKDWIVEVMNYLGTNWNQYLDVISTHIYPPTTGANSGETEGSAVGIKNSIIDVYGVEVWNSESGVWDQGFYKTANSCFSPTGEAIWPHLDSERYTRGCFYGPELLLVNFAHSLGNGLTKYFYYDSRIYADPSFISRHTTMLEYDDSIRSKGIVFAIAGHFLDGSQTWGSVSPATNTVYAYLFSRDAKPTVVLWSKDKLNHSITLSTSDWTAYDMVGNELNVTNATIFFDRAPVYVHSDSLSVNALGSAFQTATVSNLSDDQPPNLSIDEFPTGPVNGSKVAMRWLAVDDTSIPWTGQPDVVTYSYKLEGRDSDWSPWTSGTHTTYESLVPGSYTFSVRARDAAGNISGIASRPIRVMSSIPTAPASPRNLKISR
jgi:hypothetical protein